MYRSSTSLEAVNLTGLSPSFVVPVTVRVTPSSVVVLAVRVMVWESPPFRETDIVRSVPAVKCTVSLNLVSPLYFVESPVIE